MDFLETEIDGVREVRLKVHSDARGRFKRHFCRGEFAEAGLETAWVQMNHSVTHGRGSVRGLHFQYPPAAEDKLVSCTFGRVYDVAVDLRRDSPTFLSAVARELDETRMLYIPKGFAHGFQALEDEVHLVYLSSEYYAPQAEAGLRYDDPRLAIAWPLPAATMSERDLTFPLIGEGFEGV